MEKREFSIELPERLHRFQVVVCTLSLSINEASAKLLVEVTFHYYRNVLLIGKAGARLNIIEN